MAKNVTLVSKEVLTQFKRKAVIAILLIVIVSLPTVWFAGYYAGRAQAGSTPVFEHPSVPYDYLIWEDSGTYYAKNGTTGAIDYSDSNQATLMASVIDALPAEGGVIYDMITNEVIDLRKTHLVKYEDVDVANASSYDLVDVTGAGRVDLFWLAVYGASDQTMDSTVRFIVDGTTMDVDTGTLFLGHWTSGNPVKYHAAHIGGASDGGNNYGGWISYPINYKSSLKIQFISYNGTSTIWSQVYYRSFPANLRTTKFECVPYKDGQSVAGGDTLTMLNVTGRGRLLGMNQVLKSSNNFTYLESNHRFTVDGEIVETSGTEDTFLSAFYYLFGSTIGEETQIGPYVGTVVSNATTHATTAFRDFYGERGGIPYNTSLTIEWRNTESSELAWYSYIIFYEEF